MTPDMFSLRGKAVIVTGGSRGIGAALCVAFAEAGADVAVVSRKVEKCEAVAVQVRAKGAKAIAIGANVGKPEDCARVVEETAKAFGKIDVLVNNAGTNPAFGFGVDCSNDAFDKIFAGNVKGPFMLVKQVVPHMQAVGGGAIWLTIIGLLNSGLAAAYYLRLALSAAQRKDGTDTEPAPLVGVAVSAALLLAVATTLVLGIVPGDIQRAAEAAGHTLQAPPMEISAPAVPSNPQAVP